MKTSNPSAALTAAADPMSEVATLVSRARDAQRQIDSSTSVLERELGVIPATGSAVASPMALQSAAVLHVAYFFHPVDVLAA